MTPNAVEHWCHLRGIVGSFLIDLWPANSCTSRSEPPALLHHFCGGGHKRAPTRVRRTSLQSQLAIQRGKPVHDRVGLEMSAMLRPNDRPIVDGLFCGDGRERASGRDGLGSAAPITFFAIEFSMASTSDTWPVASSTMDQRSLAISAALRPHFADSKMMAWLRTGSEWSLVSFSRRAKAFGASIFAWRPAMAHLLFEDGWEISALGKSSARGALFLS